MKFIFIYTRAQAIEDQVLVDVTKTAKEAGFVYPVALTRAVWEKCVAVPKGAESHQDWQGRLWDVLMVMHVGCRANRDSSEFLFTLSVHNGRELEEVTLKAHCGPGDEYEPVITVMMPDED